MPGIEILLEKVTIVTPFPEIEVIMAIRLYEILLVIAPELRRAFRLADEALAYVRLVTFCVVY